MTYPCPNCGALADLTFLPGEAPTPHCPGELDEIEFTCTCGYELDEDESQAALDWARDYCAEERAEEVIDGKHQNL